MVNLFDIMRQAQSGSGFENLGRQYGLSVDQTQRAVEALLPAFTLALKHSAHDPALFARLLDGLGRYAPFFDGGQNLVGARRNQGAEIVETLFGSHDGSRRVAEQASALTGIGTSILHGMLPTVAAVLMGGLFRSMSVAGLSDTLKTWSDWLKTMEGSGGARTEAASGTMSLYDMWGRYAAAFMGTEPARPTTPAAPEDPWSAMFRAMSGARVPEPTPPPPPPGPNPFSALTAMFETGREVQSQYLGNLQQALDGAWGVTPSGRPPAR